MLDKIAKQNKGFKGFLFYLFLFLLLIIILVIIGMTFFPASEMEKILDVEKNKNKVHELDETIDEK
jgi:ABC-type sulfate transport system permease component